MKKIFFIAVCSAMSLWVSAEQLPLRGFSYERQTAPSGQEWQSPEAYGLNKEQPHAYFFSFANAASAQKVLPENSEYFLSLDGTWKFHWVGNPEERAKDFHQPTFDVSQWDNVPVPMSWNIYGLQKDGTQKYGTPIYVNQPVIFYHEVKVDDWRKGVMRTPPTNWSTYKNRNEVGAYRRTFTIPQNWDGRRIFINFDGVDSFFYLWINGQYVGFSKNSRNMASFDITAYLQKGENSVAVEVYRSSDGSFLEAQDMVRLPGIYRTVSLTAKPQIAVRDIQVIPDLDTQYRNGSLKITAEVTNASGKKIKDYRIDYSLYALPLFSDVTTLVSGATAQAQVTELNSNATTKAITTLSLNAPNLWTAETPYRYVLVGELKDKKGKTVETFSTYTGFREVEIKETPASEDEFGLAGRYFYVNGKPVKLKGVNRHETHPAQGHVLTRAQMEEEVMLMKRANINHVRNSHYPTAPYWYYLCDKYGIYLEDEANIESHQYYYGKESLSHVPEWEIQHTNRMLEMVFANINYPSIVIWSLGNEAGPGVNFVKSYKATKDVDTSRPIQYERNNDIVDMGSNQYPSIPWVQGAAKGKYSIKYPFHISEYAHSMGNAVGGLQDYWTAIESTNFICGGAIWDWVDQAMYNYTPEGKRYLAYGGDFGDTPNDGMFVMNGIIFADRTPKPQYYEVKKVYQYAGITATDIKAGKISLFNKNYYTDLSDYRIRWSLYEDGQKIEEGTLTTPAVAPRQSAAITIPYNKGLLKETSEYFIKVELLLAKDMPWAKAGYAQADEQLLLKSAERKPDLATVAKGEKLQLTTDAKANRVTVKGQGFNVSFDTQQGTINSLTYGNETIIAEGNGPKMAAFRAPCDNDNWAWGAWAANGLHNLKHKASDMKTFTRPDGAAVVFFTVVSQAPYGAKLYDVKASGRYRLEEQTNKPFGEDDFKFTTNQTWVIYPDGSIELQANIVSNKPQLALGRLGYEVIIPKKYDQYTYYGRGPINNYSDRKTAQFIEIHKSTVPEQLVNFAKPQTMGNREEVRWAALTNQAGTGAIFIAGSHMSTSALPWSALELLKAPHIHELPAMGDTHLHLDASVNGLGGNSCGQGGPLEHCRSFGTPQRFSFAIRPVQKGQDLKEVARVSLTSGVAPVISRSVTGQVSIAAADGDAIMYSINGGKAQVYKAPFNLRNGGKVTAWKTNDKQISVSATFRKLDIVPVSVVYASSQEAQGAPATNLVDGDPSTIWHSMYSVTVAKYPHWIDFDANELKTIKGFTLLPRQEGSNGDIKDYSIQVSTDGKTWTDVMKGSFAKDKQLKRVTFDKPVRARYIRFTALSEQSGQDFGAAAEFAIIAD